MSGKVIAHTDGACSGNPGPGGWGVILEWDGHVKELCGGEELTTNNRMELTAAIEGFRALREACEVTVITDSQYVKNGITSWVHGWKRNGWRNSQKQPVVNRDLWEELDGLVAKHRVEWTWTKGHATHADNNRCDELATQAARDQSHSG